MPTINASLIKVALWIFPEPTVMNCLGDHLKDEDEKC
jgi:hypothetical protein